MIKEKSFIPRKKRIPLNIQLFAEPNDGGDGGEGGEGAKTYTQEDIDKLIAERDSFKRANDNLSKENAEYKRKSKEHLSEEEKRAAAQKEKDELLASTQKELFSIKLSNEFLTAGFNEESSQKLVKSFNESENSIDFFKTLSTEIKTLIENVRKEEKANFMKSSKIPNGGNGGNGGDVNPLIKNIIDKKKNSSNNARKSILE